MKKILIIGLDEERWGPARLIEPLTSSGFRVATLCTTASPMRYSSSAAAKYVLSKSRSWRRLGNDVKQAIQNFAPDLIIPADEQIVVLLQHLLKRKWLGSEASRCLELTLGDPSTWSALVLKHDLRKLAESLNIPCPATERVAEFKNIGLAESKVGLPAYLKKSFAWAGEGNRRCIKNAEVLSAYDELRDRGSWAKQVIKWLCGRDWYPSNVPIELQREIFGQSAMFNIVAYRGKVLGGFYAVRDSTSKPGGPSTSVTISSNDECMSYCQKLAAALGVTGFLAFDFMWDPKLKKHFFLECNARPNQISHLGEAVGVNLCNALAAAFGMGNQHNPNLKPKVTSFALFPQYMFAAGHYPQPKDQLVDLPQRDSGLLDYMLRKVETKRNTGSANLRELRPICLISPRASP